MTQVPFYHHELDACLRNGETELTVFAGFDEEEDFDGVGTLNVRPNSDRRLVFDVPMTMQFIGKTFTGLKYTVEVKQDWNVLDAYDADARSVLFDMDEEIFFVRFSHHDADSFIERAFEHGIWTVH